MNSSGFFFHDSVGLVVQNNSFQFVCLRLNQTHLDNLDVTCRGLNVLGFFFVPEFVISLI